MTIVYKIQFHSNKQINPFEHSLSPEVHSYQWIYIQRISKRKKIRRISRRTSTRPAQSFGILPPDKKVRQRTRRNEGGKKKTRSAHVLKCPDYWKIDQHLRPHLLLAEQSDGFVQSISFFSHSSLY